MGGVVVVVNCNHCNKTFNKKPSDVHSKNFCNRICMYEFRKLENVNDKKLNKKIKSMWTTMNIRAGKYKHLQTKNKCKTYENIIITFSREEFKKWCYTQQEYILSLSRPSLDRINSSDNYTLTNIRIVELIENIRSKRPGNQYINGLKSKSIRGHRKQGNKWSARLCSNGKCKHLGTFDTEGEAMESFRENYFNLYGKYPY